MVSTVGTENDTRYRRVDISTIPQIANRIKSSPSPIALDTETTGLNPRTSKVVTIQFGTVRNAFILDCRPFYDASPDVQALWKQNLQELIDVCPLVIGHNLKFDYKMVYHHFGVKLDRVADTMLQELVLYGVGIGSAENMGIKVNMLDTASRYGLRVSKDEQKWWIDLDTRDAWSQPLPDTQLAYCAQDVFIPQQIYAKQCVELASKSLTASADLENACLPAIARMELDGCFVDRERWEQIITQKSKQRSELAIELQAALTPIIREQRETVYEEEKWQFEAWLQALDLLTTNTRAKWEEGNTGLNWGTYKSNVLKKWRIENPRPKTPELDKGPINIGSHVQLKIALKGLGVCVESTDSEHLKPFTKTIPIVGKLAKWKELDKFVNAFGDNILQKIDTDNRIHPNYNQIGAATGRMSCSQPNWQQIPSHEPDETSLRRCVIAETGNVLLTADFSNIEARILADMSQDENLLAFFQKGGDLHCTTARLMFGLDATDIELKGTHEVPALELKPGLAYRSVAKTINFGLVYGMSPVKLAKTLGVAKEVAEELFMRYFEAYPGVAMWLKEASSQALQQGYSLTLAGRKRFYEVKPEPRYDEEIMEWERFLEKRSLWYRTNGSYERQAKNAPIQGSNADITKYALVLLYRHMPSYVKLVACVHDEVVLECPTEKAHAVAKLLATAMYKACKKYLHTVYIPPVDVEIERYWKKG
jgi:DNA polymerase-1